MTQGQDSQQLEKPDQDPEPLSGSLEIQLSNPSLLNTRIITGQRRKNLCVQWVIFYYGILFSYRQKLCIIKLCHFMSSDTFTISNPTVNLMSLTACTQQHVIKAQPPSHSSGLPVTRKIPTQCFQRELISVHGGEGCPRRPTWPPTPAQLLRQPKRKHQEEISYLCAQRFASVPALHLPQGYMGP